MRTWGIRMFCIYICMYVNRYDDTLYGMFFCVGAFVLPSTPHHIQQDLNFIITIEFQKRKREKKEAESKEKKKTAKGGSLLIN